MAPLTPPVSRWNNPRMSLPIDLSRAALSPVARHRLVEAIVNAPATEPETDYLEWKAGIDLHGYRGSIAKHILGFANRQVARASRHLDGTAHLVLGAEPGAVSGIEPADSADLLNWIAPFVGVADGPQWDPHYVELEGKQVLVITVAAPRDGDRAWPCRRELSVRLDGETRQVVRNGAIYVRRGGQTVEASAAEQDMLAARARGSAVRTKVEVRPDGGLPITLRAVDRGDESVEGWLLAEERRCLDSLEKSKVTEPDVGQTALALALGREQRSPEEYTQEVRSYVAGLREKLPVHLAWRALERRIAVLPLEVRNLTDRNFAQLRVELHIEGAVKAFWEAPRLPALPRPPVKYGNKTLLNVSGNVLGDFGHVSLPRYDLPEVSLRGRIDNSRSAAVTYLPIDLRPADTEQLEDLLLVVEVEHCGLPLEVTWRATSTSADGQSDGSFEVQVAREPANALELIAAEPENLGGAEDDAG